MKRMTTLVDVATGEVLDPQEAEERASRICADLDSAAESFETAMDHMREAIKKRDDLTLGYRSPSDYLSERFGARLSRLGVDLRREVVRELTEVGLSIRAIAKVVDKSVSTTHHDREQVFDSEHLAARPTLGIDGKQYNRSVPQALKPAPDTRQSDSACAPQSEPEVQEPAPAEPSTPIAPTHHAQPSDEYDEQDRAEELARNLARNLSLTCALLNPERRAEYIVNWRAGTRPCRPLGADFVTPERMRALSAALLDFATEWENANV